jgi:hypothetical protein
MRARKNGGVIGRPNVPTTAAQSGIWSADEIATYGRQISTPTESQRKQPVPSWPEASDIDPYYNNVMLHVGPIESNNSITKDQGIYNLHEYSEIYAYNRAPLVTYEGPAYTNWSTEFSESGYLSVFDDATKLQLFTNPFTVEFWVKPLRNDATTYYIMGKSTTAGTVTGGVGWTAGINSSNQFIWVDSQGATTYTSSATAQIDTWTHVAYVRANVLASGFKMYVNGTLSMTGQLNQSYSNTSNLIIGRDGVATSTTFYGGLLSDIRISNVAMYTTNFSAPTSALASNASTIFSDSVTLPHFGLHPNAHPQGSRVSVPSNTVNRRIESPYLINDSTRPNGAGFHSAYFQGGAASMRVHDVTPTSSLIRLGTSPFTIEAWIKSSNAGPLYAIAGKGTGAYNAGGTGWTFYIDTQGPKFQNVGTTLAGTGYYPIAAGEWRHVAAVREGTGANQFKMYLDGREVFVGTVSTNFTETTSNLEIGRSRDGGIGHRGWMTGFRMSNVARYTANSTITSSFIANSMAVDSNTIICTLTTGNSTPYHHGIAWTDYGRARVPLRGQANETRIGGRHPINRFGGASTYFSGTNYDSLVATTTQQDFLFGTGDFSIEFWYKRRYLMSASDYDYLIDTRTVFSDNGIAIRDGCENRTIEVYSGNLAILTDSIGGSLEIMQWRHVCVQRVNGAIALYINGKKSQETVFTSNVFSASDRVNIGNSNYPALDYGNQLGGAHMSDLRILKGSGAYALGTGANATNPDIIDVPRTWMPIVANTVISTLNNPILKDNSGRNNYVGWNRAQYTNGNWDFYTSAASPYHAVSPWTPEVKANLVFGSTAETNGDGFYNVEGVWTAGSTNTNFSWITRMAKAWTIEFFVYAYQTNQGAPTSAACLTTGSPEGWDVQLHYNGTAASWGNICFRLFTTHNTGTQNFATTNTFATAPLNAHTWNHVVVQYDPVATNKIAIFCNGSRVANFTSAITPGRRNWTTSSLSGGYSAMPITGLRISDTARYNNDATTYTIPTQRFAIDQYTYFQPDLGQNIPYIDRTSHMTMYNRSVHYSTDVKKFGNGSIRFSNRDKANPAEFLLLYESNWSTVTTGFYKCDFTIECWAAWHDAAAGGVAPHTSLPNYLWHFQNTIAVGINPSGQWIMMRVSTGTVYWTLNSTVTAATKTSGGMDHLVACRRGGNYYFYVNGIERGRGFANSTGTYAAPGPSVNIDDSFTSGTTQMFVGADWSATQATAWTGYVQDIRMTSMNRYTTKVINGVATMVHHDSLLPALPTGILPSR